MSDGREKNYSLFQLLSYALGACVIVCGATWTVATFLQSNELEAYRKADEWKAKETITELRKLSSSLNQKLTEREELSKLRIQARKFISLQDEVIALEKERDSLAETVRTLTQETKTFSVRQGDSEYAIPNILLVGVTQVFTPTARCDVQFENRTESIYVGKSVAGVVSGINFKLSLKKVSDSACELVYQQVAGPAV